MITELLIVSAIVLLLIYLYKRIHRYIVLSWWRKELKRREWVRFFYDKKWYTGQIHSFNGKTIKVRIPNKYKTFIIPLKIVVPPTTKH